MPNKTGIISAGSKLRATAGTGRTSEIEMHIFDPITRKPELIRNVVIIWTVRGQVLIEFCCIRADCPTNFVFKIIVLIETNCVTACSVKI